MIVLILNNIKSFLSKIMAIVIIMLKSTIKSITGFSYIAVSQNRVYFKNFYIYFIFTPDYCAPVLTTI